MADLLLKSMGLMDTLMHVPIIHIVIIKKVYSLLSFRATSLAFKWNKLSKDFFA